MCDFESTRSSARTDVEPVEIEVFNDISDADADYISTWMAEAFYRKDALAVHTTGRTYEEDPEAHRLLFRGHIDRASVCGQILTTKDRNAFRIVFRPGQVDRIYDFDWRSGKDNAWDQLAARTGGYDAWRERDYEDEQVCRRAYRELYGDDVLDMFRTFTFGVKPGHQGRGIGRAMHEHTVNEAREAGAKFVFFSNLTNVPLYEQLGCKVVKTVIGAGEAERLVGYPEGSEGLAVLEAINGI